MRRSSPERCSRRENARQAPTRKINICAKAIICANGLLALSECPPRGRGSRRPSTPAPPARESADATSLRTRMVQKFARLSRCFPIIKVQHATEAHSAANRPIGSSRGSGKLEQAILDTLVIALAMVMRQVFVYGTAQRCPPDEEHSIQT